MSNCIITTAGRALIAACQANRQALTIDKMLFGYRDGLDVSTSPAADFALTAAETKHTATALTSGLLAADCAVWSAVLDAAVGDFSFNVVALASGSTLVAVAVQPAQHKVKTSGFSTGNVIIKNFGLQIVNVGDLTGIVINAETWQQDLSGLYAPLNHNHDAAYAPKTHTHPYEPQGAVSAHNGAADAHQMLFDALRGLLGGKSDAGHTHDDRYIRLLQYDFLKNENGYCKLPNGFIIQWGKAAANTGNQAFPIAFPTACFAIAAAGTTSWNRGQLLRIVSRTHFAITAEDPGETTYIAIGC